MPAANPIDPTTEARFKALADTQPLLTNAEIQQRLSQSPAIDPKIYYNWVIGYRGQQAKLKMAATPMPANTARTLLKDTTYDDPTSLARLDAAVAAVPGIARLPLGYYLDSATQPKKMYCFLIPNSDLFPFDTTMDETRGDPSVLLARPSTNIAGIPPFFIVLGKLAVTTNSSGGESATATDFVVVAGTDRKVYALFSPSAQDLYGPLDISTRQTSGRLPGLSGVYASVLLASNVNDVVVNDAINTKLTFTTYTISTGVTVQFGYVDSLGWRTLNNVSRQFANVPTYRRPSAAGAA